MGHSLKCRPHFRVFTFKPNGLHFQPQMVSVNFYRRHILCEFFPYDILCTNKPYRKKNWQTNIITIIKLGKITRVASKIALKSLVLSVHKNNVAFFKLQVLHRRLHNHKGYGVHVFTMVPNIFIQCQTQKILRLYHHTF